MTPAQTARAEELITRHLTMSGQTLDALHKAGLNDEMRVCLEFLFVAPTEPKALALLGHLETNDCLNLSVKKSGGVFSRKWLVTGQTHPTPLNVQVIAQWLPWIVVQGIAHDCEFDGWGAEV
jgi:hypothetical protein